METTKASSKKVILNYGLLLGILSVILGVVLYVTNAYLNPSFIYTIIGFLILIVVISLGIKAYKTENGGYLSLGEAIKVGIGIALIGGIITAIWTVLLMNFIEPDYMAQMMDLQREKMLASNPNMSDAQIDQVMEMSAKFASPWISTAVQLVGSLFFGLIIALVAGLIMKNQNPYERQA